MVTVVRNKKLNLKEEAYLHSFVVKIFRYRSCIYAPWRTVNWPSSERPAREGVPCFSSLLEWKIIRRRARRPCLPGVPRPPRRRGSVPILWKETWL